MSITDWIIILLFLGGLIAIGFAFSKKNKDLKDYFLAGKSMPTWLVVFAATGTSISAVRSWALPSSDSTPTSPSS